MGTDTRRTTKKNWLDRIRSAPGGRIAVKITVTVLGVSITILGLLLIPLPGPGWLIVIAGLAILAIEFHWARRLLGFVKYQLQRWTGWIKRQSLAVRALIGAIGLIFLLAIIWASVRYSLGVDVWAWVRGWLTT